MATIIVRRAFFGDFLLFFDAFVLCIAADLFGVLDGLVAAGTLVDAASCRFTELLAAASKASVVLPALLSGSVVASSSREYSASSSTFLVKEVPLSAKKYQFNIFEKLIFIFLY